MFRENKLEKPIIDSYHEFSKLIFEDFKDAEFKSFAKEICSESLNSSNTLKQALRGSQGLFPVEACYLFNEIDSDKFLSLISSNYIKPSVTPQASFLHSQWMFSENTSKKLTSILSENPGNKLLLGVPSLVDCLQHKDLIVDITKLDSIFAIQCDVRTFFKSGYDKKFDSVFIDPPWSLPCYMDWLQIAEKYLSKNGKIYMPLLGAMTRPNARKDRQKIYKFLTKMGLSAKTLGVQLEYDVPSFEASVLGRYKIPATNWRTAELIEISRSLDVPKSKSYQINLIDDTLILSATVNNIRIEGAVSSVFSEFGFLDVPVDGSIMTSTSSRNIGNRSANVFTSNGFKFVCYDVVEFFAYLRGQHWEALRAKINNDKVNQELELALCLR